jgi:hypothetical protein
MRALSWRMGTGSLWESRFLRSLAGQWGTSGDPTVLRSMGQFVPLTRPTPRATGQRSDERADRLLAWTRTGQLTYGGAESLLALDETTAWRHI